MRKNAQCANHVQPLDETPAFWALLFIGRALVNIIAAMYLPCQITANRQHLPRSGKRTAKETEAYGSSEGPSGKPRLRPDIRQKQYYLMWNTSVVGRVLVAPSHLPVQLLVLWRLVPPSKLELQTAVGPGTAGWMVGLAWSYLAEH